MFYSIKNKALFSVLTVLFITFLYSPFSLGITAINHVDAVDPNQIKNDFAHTSNTQSGEEGPSETEKFLRDVIYAIFVWPMAKLAWLGASVMDVFIDPEQFNKVFSSANSKWMYSFWSLVRDILNIFLVLVLLLSAFSTVFQIQKWHLKNTLLMIVLMALLVNFSWPVTRMFMDIGNITMYSLYDQMAGETEDGEPKKLSNELGEKSQLMNMLTKAGDEKTESVSVPLIKGIFLFAFAITLLTIGILMLLRIVIFVILLIFSPVGFIAATFPSTRQYATQWWDAMLKWTFLGPIMIFMVYLSIQLISAMGDKDHINSQGVTNSGFFANAVGYIASIVILWSGIIAANKLGGSAASAVTSRTKKFGAWGAKKMGQGYWGAAKGGGRFFDNLFGNPVSRSAGFVMGVGTRLKNMTTASKEQTQRAREEAVAWNLSKWSSAGGDKFAYEKFKTAQQGKYIKEDLADKVDLPTAVAMLESEEDPNSIKAGALQKYIASHKDLQFIDDQEAGNVANLIKDGKLAPPESRAAEATLRKNGHADALENVYGPAFADKVVKKLDAESLAKSAKLLEKAARSIRSGAPTSEAQVIRQKMAFPDFEKDFLKHAGNQGLDPLIVQELSGSLSSTASSNSNYSPGGVYTGPTGPGAVNAAKNARNNNNTNP